MKWGLQLLLKGEHTGYNTLQKFNNMTPKNKSDQCKWTSLPSTSNKVYTGPVNQWASKTHPNNTIKNYTNHHS